MFCNERVYSRSNTLSDLKSILFEKLLFIMSFVKEYCVLLSVLSEFPFQGNHVVKH